MSKSEKKPEVKCWMQGGDMVGQDWCLRVQYDDICFGCPRNLGREVSWYQEEEKAAKVET